MSRETEIQELLSIWERRRQEGRPISAEELCGPSPQLLDDVRRQIQALESASRLLDLTGAPSTITGTGAAASGSHDTLAPSAMNFPDIPGYEVLSQVGRGGMGVVYKARQIRPNRLVALKMIVAGCHADNSELARFLREAEAV